MKVGEGRFAHTEGISCISYSEDGEKIVTSGYDGELRVFSLADDDNESYLVGDMVFSLACAKDNKAYVGPNSNTVQRYSLADGESEALVTRFTAEVTAIDVSGDGKLLAAGSADMSIKLVNAEDFKDAELEGHKAPVLSVVLDKREKPEYLVSSSCDGSVKVWSVEEKNEVKAFDKLWPESSDVVVSKTRGVLAWHPKGKSFAMPVKESVKIIERGTWDEQKELKPTSELKKDEFISVVAWSSNAEFLLAGTTEGNIFLWNFNDGSCVEGKSGRGYHITGLAFKPGGSNEAVYIDNQGYWGTIDDIKAGSTKGEKSKAEKTEEQPAKPSNMDEMNEDELAAALFEDDDDDDENSFSIRKIKRSTGFLSDDEENGGDSFNPDLAEKAKGDESNDASEFAKPQSPAPVAAQPPPPAQIEMDIQEPFQSGSTPAHLSSRFMVWNSVGIVRCISSEEENSIEVEFHDTSVHHPLHLSNVHGHTMADISSEALVLACEASEDESPFTPSKLSCHHFASSDMNKEWSVDMPGKEEVMAVCCGKGWVAAATDRRRLRIFTTAGLQREALTLPGPVVTLAGHGDHLIVAVHVAMPLLGNQNVAYAIFNVGNKAAHPSGYYQPLPLAPNSILSWIGFTDEGTPALVDSAGQARILNKEYNSWFEVCDTKSQAKGKSDHHFVVGFSEGERILRSILCKGARYPHTVPQPTAGILRMSLPLCDAATEKGILEEKLIFGEMTIRAEKQEEEREDLSREQNETMIKLFALALKSEQESRAFEVCKLMDTATIQIAIKYASRMRRNQLAEKLSNLACDIQDEEERKEQVRCESQMSNADMFESQEEMDTEANNPFLAAKLKKESSGTKIRSLLESQSETRNPFKKSSSANTSSGAIRPGIVFDDMTSNSQATKSRNSNKFGARVIDKSSPAPAKSLGRQTTLTLKTRTPGNTGKENSKESSGTPLKGFQLWLAENKEEVGKKHPGLEDADLNSKCLMLWKELSKEAREAYKTPRCPKKRKREDDAEQPSAKAVKV